MISTKTNDKGAQLKRVHVGGTQVVGTSTKQIRRGTRLETNFTVKRNNADEEQKFFLKEIINDQVEKQVKAEAKQNHTFVKSKLQLVEKLEVGQVKRCTRGKERASNFAFFKELVSSNTTKTEWNVEKSNDAVDRFFMKKKTKPFSGFSIKSLGDSLTVPVDDKNGVQQNAMSSINEIVAPVVMTDAIALIAQMEALMKRVEALEESNKQLTQERDQLKQDYEKLEKVILSTEVQEEVQQLETEPKVKQSPKKTVKKVRFAKQTKQSPKKTARVNTIKGEEQCLEIESTQVGGFTDKPKKPIIPKKKQTRNEIRSHVREWYSFDKKKIEEHQKEVLASVVNGVSFADKVRQNGLPKQKIRFTQPPKKEETVVTLTPGYDYTSMMKPPGIPKNLWWRWTSTGTAIDAYEKAEKFLFNSFKREMMIYRRRWASCCKEFNPYLSEPKMVWMEQVCEYEYDVSSAQTFINKWRNLVRSYKPSTPIKNDWYKEQTKQ